MNKKTIIILFLMFMSIGYSVTDITGCQALAANTEYRLTTGFVMSGASCFSAGNNVTLNGNGVLMNYTYAVDDVSYFMLATSNVTIENLTLKNFKNTFIVSSNGVSELEGFKLKNIRFNDSVLGTPAFSDATNTGMFTLFRSGNPRLYNSVIQNVSANVTFAGYCAGNNCYPNSFSVITGLAQTGGSVAISAYNYSRLNNVTIRDVAIDINLTSNGGIYIYGDAATHHRSAGIFATSAIKESTNFISNNDVLVGGEINNSIIDNFSITLSPKASFTSPTLSTGIFSFPNNFHNTSTWIIENTQIINTSITNSYPLGSSPISVNPIFSMYSFSGSGNGIPFSGINISTTNLSIIDSRATDGAATLAYYTPAASGDSRWGTTGNSRIFTNLTIKYVNATTRIDGDISNLTTTTVFRNFTVPNDPTDLRNNSEIYLNISGSIKNIVFHGMNRSSIFGTTDVFGLYCLDSNLNVIPIDSNVLSNNLTDSNITDSSVYVCGLYSNLTSCYNISNTNYRTQEAGTTISIGDLSFSVIENNEIKNICPFTWGGTYRKIDHDNGTFSCGSNSNCSTPLNLNSGAFINISQNFEVSLNTLRNSISEVAFSDTSDNVQYKISKGYNKNITNISVVLDSYFGGNPRIPYICERTSCDYSNISHFVQAPDCYENSQNTSFTCYNATIDELVYFISSANGFGSETISQETPLETPPEEQTPLEEIITPTQDAISQVGQQIAAGGGGGSNAPVIAEALVEQNKEVIGLAAPTNIPKTDALKVILAEYQGIQSLYVKAPILNLVNVGYVIILTSIYGFLSFLGGTAKTASVFNISGLFSTGIVLFVSIITMIINQSLLLFAIRGLIGG